MFQRHAARKTRVISALQILLILVTIGNSVARCPDRYSSVGTRCYYFDDEDRITWYQAYFKCKFNLKGYLVEIENQEEQNNLRQQIQNTVDPAGKYSFWIGASDLILENDFRWMTTGKLLTFKAWNARTNEPNNQLGIENCVMIYKAADYNWNDYSCTNSNGDLIIPPLRAICEADPY